MSMYYNFFPLTAEDAAALAEDPDHDLEPLEEPDGPMLDYDTYEGVYLLFTGQSDDDEPGKVTGPLSALPHPAADLDNWGHPVVAAEVRALAGGLPMNEDAARRLWMRHTGWTEQDMEEREEHADEIIDAAMEVAEFVREAAKRGLGYTVSVG